MIGRWLSFLSLAREELLAPLFAAVAAAAVLLLLAKLAPPEPLYPWIFALPGFAELGAFFWGWLRCNRRLHVLEDIPLSRVASAAQGYVRLEGRAKSFPGKALVSPMTKQVSCWYSYEYYERDRQGHKTVSDSETSVWSFVMSDGSGDCVVDPAGAELIPARVERWREMDRFFLERSIRPGDPLFVIGQYATSSPAVLERDIDFQVGQRIAEWKKDMPALVRRFDLNADGQFSEQEWDLLRAEARREVVTELARNPPQPQNAVSRPAGDDPYIVSGMSRSQLTLDLKIWAWLNLGGFVACAVLLGKYLYSSGSQ